MRLIPKIFRSRSQTPVQPDFSEPGVGGDLEADQTGNFTVIDPETGKDTDDE